MIKHNQGKQAFKRVRSRLNLEVNREPLPSFAWPGGYPIYYVMRDCEVVCPACANKLIREIDFAMKHRDNKAMEIDAMSVNYEDDLQCVECHEQIPSAYTTTPA